MASFSLLFITALRIVSPVDISFVLVTDGLEKLTQGSELLKPFVLLWYRRAVESLHCHCAGAF